MSLKFNEFDKENDILLTKLTVNSEIGSDIPHLAGYTKLFKRKFPAVDFCAFVDFQ